MSVNENLKHKTICTAVGEPGYRKINQVSTEGSSHHSRAGGTERKNRFLWEVLEA
jgi:hypothetical protein